MAQRIVRSIGAFLILVLGVVGLPIALVAYGRSPLDGVGSLWEQLTALMTNAMSDVVVFGLLTIIAWVFWALFVSHVAVELAAALGRGTRWRPPPAGPLQAGARRLVMAIVMTTTLTGPLGQRGSAAPRLEPAPVAAVTVDLPDRPGVSDGSRLQPVIDPVTELATSPGMAERPPTIGAGGTSTPTSSAPSIVVAPGDSPWELAERHLGEGLRWREIWDLNRGVAQPDGRAWVTEDLIHPGWRLCLPADATGLTEAAPVPVPMPEPKPPEPPPEQPGQVPDEQVGVTPAEPATTTLPQDAEPDATADDPDGDRGEGPDDDSGDEVPWAARGLLGAGGAVLAAVVMRELRRRTSRRDVQTPAWMRAPDVRRVEVDTELFLRADEPAVTRLDRALAHLAANLHPRPGESCPVPRVVLSRGGRVDLMVDPPHPSPPAPWRTEAAGLFWVLDEDEALPAGDDPSPLPALVTVGVDDAQLLIDLEAFGVVALVGDPAACQQLARSVVAEMAMRSEGTLAIELVGDVLGDSSEQLEGVRRRAGWDDVEQGLVATSAGLLETGGWPHTFSARSSGRIYDGWAPTIWVTGAESHPTYLDTVSTLAGRPGCGAAVLVVGHDPGHGLRIHLDAAGRFEIPALGLDGVAQGIEAGVAEQLTDLLANADEPATEPLQVVVPAEPALPRLVSSEGNNGGGRARDYEDLAYGALVRLCGTIRIDGVDEHLTQRELAIATYVALKGSADVDQLRDAVWNGAAVSRKTVQNTVSVVKSKLGPALTTGQPGTLRAADDLVTDIELIRRRLAHADAIDDPEEQVAVLTGAVDLVTGPVCGYPDRARTNWRWLLHDNWRSHVEALVTTAATELAHFHLEAGRLSDVRTVVQKGIDAVGRREDLIVLLTKSHEAAGDHDTARSIIREHEAYLADLGVDEFNDDLLELLDRYATPAHHKPT